MVQFQINKSEMNGEFGISTCARDVCIFLFLIWCKCRLNVNCRRCVRNSHMKFQNLPSFYSNFVGKLFPNFSSINNILEGSFAPATIPCQTLPTSYSDTNLGSQHFTFFSDPQPICKMLRIGLKRVELGFDVPQVWNSKINIKTKSELTSAINHFARVSSSLIECF